MKNFLNKIRKPKGKDPLAAKLEEKLSNEDLDKLRTLHASFRTAAITKARAEGHLNKLMEEVLETASRGSKNA